MLTCASGNAWNPFGPPCALCIAWLEQKLAENRANIAAGKYASDGYTLDERAAKFARAQPSLFSFGDSD